MRPDPTRRPHPFPLSSTIRLRPVPARSGLFAAWLAVLLVAGPAAVAPPAVSARAAEQAGEVGEANEGDEEAPKVEVAVDEWLLLGPVRLPLPAFAGEGPEGSQGRVAVPELLAAPFLPEAEAWPEAGQRVGAGGAAWAGAGDALVWERRSGSRVELDPGEAGRPARARLATYVETGRFLEAELVVASSGLVRVLLDGEEVASQTKGGAGSAGKATGGRDEEDAREEGGAPVENGSGSEADPEDGGEKGGATATLELPTGKHLVVVEAVDDAEHDGAWWVEATLSVAEEHRDAIAVAASPRRGITMSDLLDVATIDGIDLSADGALAALSLARPVVPAEDRDSWVEIRDAGDGSLVRSWAGTPVEGFTWAPVGRRYAYLTREEEKATLWVGDLASGELEPLVEDVERLGGIAFSPDASFLVYSVGEPPEEAEPTHEGVRRVESLPDRWAGFRDKSHLWQVTVANGARRRLTAGPASTDFQDVSADGSRVLFTRTDHTAERPFSFGEVWELDLATLEPRRLVRVPWLGGASYSPDGRWLLVAAGPSGFGALGADLPERAKEALGEEAAAEGGSTDEGAASPSPSPSPSEGEAASAFVPNEYDGQLFLVDLEAARRDGEDGVLDPAAVRALTRDFDPAVADAEWGTGGDLFVTATAGEEVHLYRVRPGDGAGEPVFERIEAGVEVVESIALADDAPVLLYTGSSATEPHRAASLAFDRPGGAAGDPRLVLLPGAPRYEQVDFGRVESFDFDTAAGTIAGRVYYPPDFDPDARYPLLVYYYGGTVPTDRSFGGRYPKNLWAADGYVVYVLQPSGATGFGQAFSARHVNDWGKVVAGEIVAGIEAFLEAHPFVERDSIGSFGGSYGGFMTMLLITETDLLSAAISHAGISSISSYWGEGWWGYLYSAVATAGSYPWNRPDLYVDQSPLFRADRIETPLLLLHGTADPNVPIGESQQMYTALRILDKEVELVTFEGEAHWILDYPKRKLWWSTILAWFDKHLKGEPEWWESLWGEGE